MRFRYSALFSHPAAVVEDRVPVGASSPPSADSSSSSLISGSLFASGNRSFRVVPMPRISASLAPFRFIQSGFSFSVSDVTTLLRKTSTGAAPPEASMMRMSSAGGVCDRPPACVCACDAACDGDVTSSKLPAYELQSGARPYVPWSSSSLSSS